MATYYLDSATGDDTNAGTEALPWKTLARAQTFYAGEGTKVTDGDTVYFGDGSYGSYTETAKTRTDWVTYKAKTGCSPVLTQIKIANTGTLTNPSPYNTYLIFDGFAITTSGDLNPNSGVYYFYSNYIQILNCTITCQDKGIEGFYSPYWYSDTADYGVYVRYSTHITIDSCDITGCYQGILVLKNSDNINNEYITITNNTIHNIAGDGLSLAGSHMTVTDNYIYDIDCRRAAIGIVGTLSGAFQVGEAVSQANSGATGVYLTTRTGGIVCYLTSEQEFAGTNVYPELNGTITGAVSEETLSSITTIDPAHTDCVEITSLVGGLVAQHNITFERNKCIRLLSPPYLQNTQTLKLDGGQGVEFVDVVVENNLFVSNDYNVYPMILAGLTNLKFNNNTLYGSQIRMSVIPLSGGLPYEGSCIIAEFYNNIVSGLTQDTTDVTETYYSRILEHGNNIFYKEVAYNGSGTHTYPVVRNETGEDIITGEDYNDLFVNYSGYDFTLVAGSDAINYGDADKDPSFDILGNVRDAAHHSAGCYEYDSDAGGYLIGSV